MIRTRSGIATAALIAGITALILIGASGAFYLITNSAPRAAVSNDTTQASQTSSQDLQNTTVTNPTTQASQTSSQDLQNTTVTNPTTTAVTQTVTGNENNSGDTHQIDFVVAPGGAGTTDPSGSGTLSYTNGVLVQISVTQNPGYSFSSWIATNPSIVFGCATCTSTAVEIGGSGTIVANFVVESGPAYVTQTCSAHGLGIGQTTPSCSLTSPIDAGQTILVEAAVIPGTNISDSMGNQYALLGNASFPGSTYFLEVFSATASMSGTDSIVINGSGNFAAIVVHVLAGVTGVEAVSNGSAISATPSVPPFQPQSGSLVIAAVLIHSNEGWFNTSVNAGPGYNLVTVGPSIADEDALSYGSTTSPQFGFQSPEDWGEVSIAFSTSSSSMTTTNQMGVAPGASNAAGALAIVFLFTSYAGGSEASRPTKTGARFGKTVLCDAVASPAWKS